MTHHDLSPQEQADLRLICTYSDWHYAAPEVFDWQILLRLERGRLIDSWWKISDSTLKRMVRATPAGRALNARIQEQER